VQRTHPVQCPAVIAPYKTAKEFKMGHSLSVETKSPRAIDVEKLKAEVSKITSFLLNQPPEDFLTLEVVADKDLNWRVKFNEKVEIEGREWEPHLVPCEEFNYLFETKFLDCGISFMYSLDEYWKEYSNEPVYSFTIMQKIYPEQGDMGFVICTALMIAVANLLSVKGVVDVSGFFITDKKTNDAISVEELLNLRVLENVSVDEALSLFYKKLAP